MFVPLRGGQRPLCPGGPAGDPSWARVKASTGSFGLAVVAEAGRGGLEGEGRTGARGDCRGDIREGVQGMN